MTPKERHALADRLDRMAERNERTAKVMGGLSYGWANDAADLRAAAAALREMPSTEEVVTAARASLWEQLESEAVERLTAELARLREVLPTVNEIERVRAIVRGDDPIGRMLARFEVARILLDAMG